MAKFDPEPKYVSDHGVVNAELRRAGTAPELSYDNGSTVHYLATGAMTDREFGLHRWNFSPAASGSDPHFHKTITESFFILDGVVQLYDGRHWTNSLVHTTDRTWLTARSRLA